MSIPGSVSPLFIRTAEAAPFQINRSLRFNSADSAYLNRTPSSAGNRKTFTLSWWLKRSGLTTFQSLFNSFTDLNNRSAINFDSSIGAGGSGDYLTMFDVSSGSLTSIFQTNALFRDVSAWYHIVVAVDTTQASSSDRVKLYVNNILQTFLTYNAPSQNADLHFNSAATHYFGVYGGSPSTTAFGFNGYLANVLFIDGQALAPTDFGETDSDNNWNPKAFVGSFGTNGFYLKFADNSSNAALGTDSSGNSNTFTVNNLSVAAGADNDSLIDTPMNITVDSGNNPGNYATLNPLNPHSSSDTFSNGNLDFTGSSNAGISESTIAISSGKYYFEAVFSGGQGTGQFAGIRKAGSINYNDSFLYVGTGNKYINASTGASYGATLSNGDVIGTAFDADNGTLIFYKNGVSQGTAYTGITGTYAFFVGSFSTAPAYIVNFGQRPFAISSIPSGYTSLCTTNLPDPTIADGSTVFMAKTYSGTGSTNAITGLNFSPDFLWLKRRNGSNAHALFDQIRGVTKVLESSNNGAEKTNDPAIASFDSNGFTVNGTYNQTNASSQTYIAWAWDAGSSTVTNNDGSIASSVRANPSSGISICSYTGTGSTATFGHGLNAAPELVIIKSRSDAQNWAVYSKYTSGAATPAEEYAFLNSDSAFSSSGGGFFWSNTSPTNSAVTVGSDNAVNGSGKTYIALCFAPVFGYSSFGVYTGNGSTSTDGPFVYTGHRSRFILIKRSDGTANWQIYDTARDTFNAMDSRLKANSSDAEVSNSGYNLDILSNGFRPTGGNNDNYNASGASYIYASLAEHPFKTARAR